MFLVIHLSGIKEFNFPRKLKSSRIAFRNAQEVKVKVKVKLRFLAPSAGIAEIAKR